MPWYIQNSAASFSSFLGSYALFLAAITGVLVTDTWLVRRRKVAVSALYRKTGVFAYWRGWNCRAFAAFACGIAPNLPGLAKVCGAKISISIGAEGLYSLSWLVSLILSGWVYWACCWLVPVETCEELEGIEVDNGASPAEESGQKAPKGEAVEV